MIADPDALKQVLVKDFDCFVDREVGYFIQTYTPFGHRHDHCSNGSNWSRFLWTNLESNNIHFSDNVTSPLRHSSTCTSISHEIATELFPALHYVCLQLLHISNIGGILR